MSTPVQAKVIYSVVLHPGWAPASQGGGGQNVGAWSVVPTTSHLYHWGDHLVAGGACLWLWTVALVTWPDLNKSSSFLANYYKVGSCAGTCHTSSHGILQQPHEVGYCWGCFMV